MKSNDSYWDARLEERHLIVEMLKDKHSNFSVLEELYSKEKDYEIANRYGLRASICHGLIQAIQREDHVK